MSNDALVLAATCAMTLTQFKSQYRHEGQVKLQVEVRCMINQICFIICQRIERRDCRRGNTAQIYGCVSLL